MRQGFQSLLVLPILLSFFTTAAIAEEKTVAPPLAAGKSISQPASAASTADVYRLLHNAGAVIDRVTGALEAKPADTMQNTR